MYRMHKLDNELIVNIDHIQPVELAEMSDFLLSIQGLCNDYLKDKNCIIPSNGIEFKLSATDKGSIELIFKAFLAVGMIAAADPNTIPTMISIADYIKLAIEHYASGKKEKSKNFTSSVENAKHVAQFTGIAKDKAKVNTLTVKVDQINQYIIMPDQAIKAHSGALQYLEDAKETFEKDLSKVLLKIDAFRDDKDSSWRAVVYDSQVPDRESYPLFFSNHEDSDFLREFKENPAHYKFWADIQVRYNEGDITAYKVLRLYRDQKPIKIKDKERKERKKAKIVNKVKRKKQKTRK